MDVRYYADTNPQTRQPDGLFRVILDTDASWAENLTHGGWEHNDDRASDVEEPGVRPVSEQQAGQIAQRVFGQELAEPINPWEHPDETTEADQPTPSADAAAATPAKGGDTGARQAKPKDAAAAPSQGAGGSSDRP